LKLYRDTQLGKAGHGIFADSARDDTPEVAEVGINIDRESVHRHPFANPDADCADLGFLSVGRITPDTDAAFDGPGRDAKFCQRGNHPVFHRMDIAPDIGIAFLQVENHIAHPLARTMIGMAAPATGVIDGKGLAQQLRRIRAGPGGIKRWMLEQPDQFLRIACLNRGVAPFHFGERFRIFDLFRRNAPFNVIGTIHRNFVHFCWPGGKGWRDRNGFGNENMKLDYMQCWNGAMALLVAHKEAILAIAGVFLFLPTLLFAQYVAPPVLTGEEDANALIAAYSVYFNENALAILASNLVMGFGGLAIYFALVPSRSHTVAENLGAALKFFVIYLLANLLSGLIILPGLLLFILPGLYLSCRFVLIPVILADQLERSPVELLKQSWSITRDNGFSILFFLAIIMVVGGITLNVLEAMTGVVVGLATGGEGWMLILNLVASLIGTIFQLIIYAVIVSIYIELTGKRTRVGEVFN